jgi:hypothetical protein
MTVAFHDPRYETASPDEIVLLSLWRGPIRMRVIRPSVSAVALDVARRHGVARDVLRGPGRTNRAGAAARHELMWQLREGLRLTEAVTARILRLDRSTIRNGVRRHIEWRRKEGLQA